MQEQLPKKKYTLETIPKDVATSAHTYLSAIASGTASNEEINWLIDNIEPKAIKDLSRLNEYLSESKALEEIIKRKSLPPNFFD
ncbi:MAG: hypothetical protein V4665_00990 [Patescibacteria group bacterium]